MKFLFLLVVQGILISGIESFSVSTHVVRGRGVQALNVTVGLHGECNNGKEPGGKIVALSRKGGGSGGRSGSGGRGGSGKGAPGSGGSDISHRPRSKASSSPSTSSGLLFLLILGLTCELFSYSSDPLFWG